MAFEQDWAQFSEEWDNALYGYEVKDAMRELLDVLVDYVDPATLDAHGQDISQLKTRMTNAENNDLVIMQSVQDVNRTALKWAGTLETGTDLDTVTANVIYRLHPTRNYTSEPPQVRNDTARFLFVVGASDASWLQVVIGRDSEAATRRGIYTAGTLGWDDWTTLTDGFEDALDTLSDNLTTLTGRVDAIDTDVSDAAVGADGVQYGSLGSAIRTQISTLTDDIKPLQRYATVSQGTISGSIEEAYSAIRLRTEIFESPHNSTEIKITNGYKVQVLFYNSSREFANRTEYYTANTTINFGGEYAANRYYVRLLIGKTDDTTIYPPEINTAIDVDNFKFTPDYSEFIHAAETPFVTPEMFGGRGYTSEAEMDTVTIDNVPTPKPYDATHAIQAAIDTGKPVYFGARAYYISAPLVLKNGSALVGGGKGDWAKLVWNTTTTADMVRIPIAENKHPATVTIRGLRFDGGFYARTAVYDGYGNGGYFEGGGSHTYYSTRAVIDDIYTERCRYGVILNATGSTLTNSTIYGGGSDDGEYYNYLNQGLAVYNTDNFISNIRVASHYKIGVNLQAGSNMLSNVKSCVNNKGFVVSGHRQRLNDIYAQENYEDNIRVISSDSSVITFTTEGAGCYDGAWNGRAEHIAQSGLSEYGGIFLNSCNDCMVTGVIRVLTRYGGSTGAQAETGRLATESYGLSVSDNAAGNDVRVTYALGTDETYAEMPVRLLASQTAIDANHITFSGEHVTEV